MTPVSPHKIALATVGSTAPFPGLIEACLSEPVLTTLSQLGYTELRLQHGSAEPPPAAAAVALPHLHITNFSFAPTLSPEITQADLIISHAGAGTILEVLRMGKRLVIVPNQALMDNHQVELAEELDRLGYCVCGTVKSLSDAIRKASSPEMQFTQFPRSSTSKSSSSSVAIATTTTTTTAAASAPSPSTTSGISAFSRIVDEEMGFLTEG